MILPDGIQDEMFTSCLRPYWKTAPQGCVTVPDTQLRIPQVEPGMIFFFIFFGIPILDYSQGLKEGLGPYILTGLQTLQLCTLKILEKT